MSRLCKAAGISGLKTNHSLRVTNATQLYASGVDEQLVMERTGHRSVDGVRTYKRTSDDQQVAPSDILNRAKRTRTGPLDPSLNLPPLVDMAGPMLTPTPFTLTANATSTNETALTQLSQSSTTASIPGHSLVDLSLLPSTVTLAEYNKHALGMQAAIKSSIPA